VHNNSLFDAMPVFWLANDGFNVKLRGKTKAEPGTTAFLCYMCDILQKRMVEVVLLEYKLKAQQQF
jgi:hypothetical protein